MSGSRSPLAAPKNQAAAQTTGTRRCRRKTARVIRIRQAGAGSQGQVYPETDPQPPLCNAFRASSRRISLEVEKRPQHNHPIRVAGPSVRAVQRDGMAKLRGGQNAHRGPGIDVVEDVLRIKTEGQAISRVRLRRWTLGRLRSWRGRRRRGNRIPRAELEGPPQPKIQLGEGGAFPVVDRDSLFAWLRVGVEVSVLRVVEDRAAGRGGREGRTVSPFKSVPVVMLNGVLALEERKAFTLMPKGSW
jgi:hypothetical protein